MPEDKNKVIVETEWSEPIVETEWSEPTVEKKNLQPKPSKQPLPKGADSFSNVWKPALQSKSPSGSGGSTLTSDIVQNIKREASKPQLLTPEKVEDAYSQRRIDAQRRKLEVLTDENNNKRSRIQMLQETQPIQQNLQELQKQIETIQEQYGEQLPPDVYEQYQSLVKEYEPLYQEYQKKYDAINQSYEKSKVAMTNLKSSEDEYQRLLASQFDFGKKVKAATLATRDNIVKSAGRIVETIGDIANVYHPLGYHTAQQLDLDQKITDQIGRDIYEYGQSLERATDKDLPKAYKEYSPLSDKFDADKFLYFGMNATAQLAPTLAMAFATGGAGAAATGFTMEFGGLYDSFHTPIKEKYIAQGLSETEAEKRADMEAGSMATIGATAIGQLDRLGSLGIVDQLTKRVLLKNYAKEVAEQVAKSGGKVAANEIAQRSATKVIKDFTTNFTKTTLPEAGTEFIQEPVAAAESDIYDFLTDENTFKDQSLTNKETWINAGNAFIGALVASSPAGVYSGYRNIASPTNYEMAMKLKDPDDFQVFEASLAKEVESGLATQEQAESAIQNIQRMQQADTMIPESIDSPLQRSQGVALLMEKEDIQAEIEGKDKSLVKPQMERINEIDANLEKISRGNIIEENDGTTNTIEQPIEGGVIQPTTTPQGDSGVIEEGVTETNIQTEIDEKAQTEKAEVGVLDRDTALPTDGSPAAETGVVQGDVETGGVVGGEVEVFSQTDNKGRTIKYFSSTTEKDGVTKTTFTFNRSDKDSSQRNNALSGVPVETALGDKYTIDETYVPEGAKIIGVSEIRVTENGAAATVMFEVDGQRFQVEVKLKEQSTKETPAKQELAPPIVEQTTTDEGGVTTPTVSQEGLPLTVDSKQETLELTPEQKEKHNKQASGLGWDNAPQAINSINKRLGTDYKTWESIPKHVKEFVSSFRNAVEKQKTDFNVALKAAYKYLDMAVKDGEITREEADNLANMAAERATPKTEKKGTLAEGVSATTQLNQADFKNQKVSMLKAMREKFNSFFKGVRAGKKDERTVRKIEQGVAAELRKDAKAYKDSLGINMNSVPNKSKLSMAARMATIRTIGDFMRFKDYVDNIAKKADFYEKVSTAKKIAKKISKINPSKLTATDREFIAKIEFLDAKYVSDIDGYVEMLNEFYDAKNNPQKYASKDIKTKISEYLTKEQAYVDGVKEAKRIEAEEAQAEDDRLLAETAIASGSYSGTVSEFIEDLNIARQESIDSKASEQEAIAEAREKIKEARVSNNEVNEIAVKAFFRTIAPQIKDAFEQAGLLKEFVALKKWAETGTNAKTVLNSEQSALLGNVLQNIDESQDFSGITVVTGAIKLANKANDIESLNPIFRKLRDKRNYTPIGLATALSTSRDLANKLQDILLINWDSLIAKGRKFHAEKMGEFKRVMKSAGVNTFSQEMRIDTFAFINQWFTDLTADEQVAHFQSRVSKRAQDAKYNFNQSGKNVGERNRLDQRKAEEIIKALESFGLIEDVVFTDLGKGIREVDFKMVEGKTPTDIQNALTVGEKKVYDYINGLFNGMQGKIKNSVITGTNQAWREITNYYPTFTESMNLTDDEMQNRLSFAGSMFNISKTSGNAKARIDDISKIASERRTYKSGLFETMNTGLWENILIAEMQPERNYVVSLFSDKSPLRTLLGDYDFKRTRDLLWNKYSSDLSSFNIPKEESTIGGEVLRAASNMMVGFILKNPTQLYKQMGGYISTMIHYPKESMMAFRFIQELYGNPQARILLESMSILGRDPVALQDIHSSDFPADYILNKNKRMTVKAIRSMSAFADKFGDILMPLAKKIAPKATQDYNSIMEYTDNINNNYIAWAGYVHALMNQKGLTDYASVRAELFRQMAQGSLDQELIQQSENWVETMNSASNKSNYPTILTASRLLYWMKSFSFITYNMYEENALAAKEATNQEERDYYKRQAAMYRTQAIYFRVVSAITQQAALEGLVYLVNSLMTDDDDEEKEKELKYKLEAMGLGVVASLLLDLKFANRSVWADISAAVITNVIWQFYSANEKDKLSQTDPDFNPNTYAKSITIEPKAGGSVASLLDFGKKTAEEAVREFLILNKAEVNIPKNIKETMFYFPAFLMGSGTGRMAVTSFDKDQDEKIKKIGILTTYGLRGEQIEEAIKILKDVPSKDVRKHIFALKMGKNLKSKVYVVDKDYFDKKIKADYKRVGDMFPIMPYQKAKDKIEEQKANRNKYLNALKVQYMETKPFDVDHFDPKFFEDMEESQATQATEQGDNEE